MMRREHVTHAEDEEEREEEARNSRTRSEDRLHSILTPTD